MKPYYTSYNHWPSALMPVGMWRTDGIVTKELDGKEIEILRFSSYYEVSATGIEEF